MYNGNTYETRYGISSLPLGPVQSNGFHNAYYSPYGSLKQYFVSTDSLRNENLTDRNFDYIGNLVTYVGARAKGNQTNSQVIDISSNIMFFTMPNQNKLGCWNINKALSEVNVAFEDPTFTYPWDIIV